MLFRRLRHVLIQPEGAGLIATTRAFDHEVRPPAEAFAGAPKVKVSAEMLDLARREHVDVHEVDAEGVPTGDFR